MNRSFSEEWAGRTFFFFGQGNSSKEIPLTNNSNKSSHLFSTYRVSDVVLIIFTSLVP